MELTEKQKQVLVLGLLLCAILLAFTLYFQFVFFAGAVTAANEDTKKKTEETAVLIKEYQDMDKFIKDDKVLNELRTKIAEFKKRLPSDPQAIQFLTLLRESLQKTNVSFTRIERANAVMRSMYQEIPYLIKGSARYHEFGQFLNLIECHPERFLRVSEFTIDDDDRRPTVHPMNMKITTFMFQAG